MEPILHSPVDSLIEFNFTRLLLDRLNELRRNFMGLVLEVVNWPCVILESINVLMVEELEPSLVGHFFRSELARHLLVRDVFFHSLDECELFTHVADRAQHLRVFQHHFLLLDVVKSRFIHGLKLLTLRLKPVDILCFERRLE